MTFEEYLKIKKIDSSAYKKGDVDQWTAFESIFKEMHPKSFTIQKLNLINGIRRRFPLNEESAATREMAKVAKPVMKKKEAAGESKSAIKPKMARPVMKKKEEGAEEANASAKPIPVIRPKTDTSQPKAARPVIKPKIKKKPDDETSSN